MNLIFRLTIRQLLRQRRTLLLWLLAALPVLLAVVFRVTGATAAEEPGFAPDLLADFIATLVLPLTALVVGTSALGQELEDGTIVYLVAKPLPRWKVVLAKLAAAWLVTSLVVALSVVTAGLVVLGGTEDQPLVPAFVVAVAAGALGYTAVFVSLSIRFGRALVIGLAYIFVWETLVSQFIVGVRFLSIRAYTLSIADALAGSASRLLDTSLGATPAVVLLGVVALLATWYAVRLLTTYQLAERV